jgi:hypothetical protein
MADPISMSSIIGGTGLATSLVGGLIGAFGAEKTGQAQQQMFNYQAAVAQINSKIDLQNRDYAINQGEQQSAIYGMKEAQTFGQIRASQGASNIDVNSGSSAAVQSSERAVGAIDTTTIRSNAAKVAFDYQTKSTMDLNQSTLDTMAGINAKTAGDINATASILGTAGSVATKWMQGSTAGLFGSGTISGGGGSGMGGGTINGAVY